MKHVSDKNFTKNNPEIFFKKFSTNTPFPHIVKVII